MASIEKGRNEQGTEFDMLSDEDPRLTSRERARRQLQRDMEAYLARGGQIQELEISARSELGDH